MEHAALLVQLRHARAGMSVVHRQLADTVARDDAEPIRLELDSVTKRAAIVFADLSLLIDNLNELEDTKEKVLMA